MSKRPSWGWGKILWAAVVVMGILTWVLFHFDREPIRILALECDDGGCVGIVDTRVEAIERESFKWEDSGNLVISYCIVEDSENPGERHCLSPIYDSSGLDEAQRPRSLGVDLRAVSFRDSWGQEIARMSVQLPHHGGYF